MDPIPAKIVITLEAYTEFHEEQGGGDYHFHPAIRFDVDVPSKKQISVIHRCEDLPNVHFDDKAAALVYASEWLYDNISIICEAAIECVKD
jgi:hypothetical protein